MMERYAQVLQQLQLVQHAIQHTYDAAHDECDALDAQMPAEYYITALKQLCEHRDNLVKEMEYIRQEEIIEDEIAQMSLLALRVDRLKEWLATH